LEGVCGGMHKGLSWLAQDKWRNLHNIIHILVWSKLWLKIFAFIWCFWCKTTVVNAWRAKINQNLEVSCPCDEEEMKKNPDFIVFENVTKCKELGIRLLTSSTGFN
jgi:hypothetical protein